MCHKGNPHDDLGFDRIHCAPHGNVFSVYACITNSLDPSGSTSAPILAASSLFHLTLSVSLHIQTVISSCAQTLYALRVLRAHGLHDSALHNIYTSVVLGKLLYASTSNATDRRSYKHFSTGANDLVFATVKLMILPLYVLQLLINKW